MAARKTLRPVADGETAEPKKLTVSEAAKTGSHKALLISTRDRIARTVDNPDCPPRDLAALTRRLTDISKELEAIAARDAEEDEGASADTDDDSWDAEAL